LKLGIELARERVEYRHRDLSHEEILVKKRLAPSTRETDQTRRFPEAQRLSDEMGTLNGGHSKSLPLPNSFSS